MGISMIRSSKESHLLKAHNYLEQKFKGSVPPCFITDDPTGGLTDVHVVADGKLSCCEHFLVCPTKPIELSKLNDLAMCQVGKWHVCNLKAAAEEETCGIFDERIDSTQLAIAAEMLRYVALADDGVDWNDRLLAAILMQELYEEWGHHKTDPEHNYSDFLLNLIHTNRFVQRVFLLGEKRIPQTNQRTALMVFSILEMMSQSVVVFSAADGDARDLADQDSADMAPQDESNEADNTCGSTTVDWTGLDVVLSLPREQQQQYVAATAHRHLDRIRSLEHWSGRKVAIALPCLMDALESAVLIDAMPGSLSLKIFGVPDLKAENLAVELRREAGSLAERVLLAFAWNHSRALSSSRFDSSRQQVLRSKIVGVEKAADDTLLAEKKYSVLLPSLEDRSFMSLWMAPTGCRSTSVGRQQTANISHFITLWRREVWCLRQSHKVLFLSRASPINLRSVFQLGQANAEVASEWAGNAARKFQIGEANIEGHVNRDTMQLVVNSEQCYFVLFTWDVAFHKYVTKAVSQYLRSVLEMDSVVPMYQLDMGPIGH